MEMENVIEIEVEPQESAPQGLSAYEVYLNNGGTLSEEEWLASLRGPQGPQGIPGPAGSGVTLEEVQELIDTAIGSALEGSY